MLAKKLTAESIATSAVVLTCGLAAAGWGAEVDPDTATAMVPIGAAIAGGVLGNYSDRWLCTVADGTIKLMTRKRREDEALINHDLARAARAAQLRAAHFIARRLRAELPLRTEVVDRTTERERLYLIKFERAVADWRAKAERALKSGEFVLPTEDVKKAGETLRSLLAEPRDVSARERFEPIWRRSSELMLEEIAAAGAVAPELFRTRMLDLSGGEDSFHVLALAFFADQLKTEERLFRAVMIDSVREMWRGQERIETKLIAAKEEILGKVQSGLGDNARRIGELHDTLTWLASAHSEASEEIHARLDALAASIVGQVDAREALARAVDSEYAGRGLVASDVRAVIAQKSKVFVGRSSDVAVLDAFVQDADRGLMIVSGPPGYGKSSLLAHWMSQRQLMGDTICRHFISGSHPVTTDALAILEHLLQQLIVHDATPMDRIPDTESKLLGEIFERLKSPPRGARLIVVLDGLDEAAQSVRSFVRSELGEGVYVVVSVRAGKHETPVALAPWMQADLRDVPLQRHDVEPLSLQEIVDWLRASASGASMQREHEIARSLRAATDGVPLFLSFVVQDLVEAMQRGPKAVARTIDALPSPFEGYVRNELDGLNELSGDRWSAGVRELFALLTCVMGPISAAELTESGLVPREVNLMRMDHRIERWFSISGSHMDRRFAFHHPRLAEVFAKVLGSQSGRARDALARHASRWNEPGMEYAAAYASDHLMMAARESNWARDKVEKAAALLTSIDFHARRARLSQAGDLALRSISHLDELSRHL